MPIEYILYAFGFFLFFVAVVWPAYEITKNEVGGLKGFLAFIGILIVFILVSILFVHPPGYVGWPFS